MNEPNYTLYTDHVTNQLYLWKMKLLLLLILLLLLLLLILLLLSS